VLNIAPRLPLKLRGAKCLDLQGANLLSKVQSTANYREYSSVIALITQAKNARNGFAHRNEKVDKDSAEKSLNAAFALASYKLKIDLKHSIYVPQILSYGR
ncbi:hypothetical protein ACK3ZS_07065, partial [Aeromonas caviae]